MKSDSGSKSRVRRALAAAFWTVLGVCSASAVSALSQALYVSVPTGSGGGLVAELDPVTYALRGPAFQGSELSVPDGLGLGPDGNVYVLSSGTGEVLRYAPDSGQFLGVAVALGEPISGGLSSLGGRITFGSNGDLYLGGLFSGAAELRRYDAGTGALLGTLPGVAAAFAFAPDGTLLAADRSSNEVVRYDAETFASLGSFVTVGQPADSVTNLAFDAAGNLYALAEGVEPVNFEGIVEVFRFDPFGAQTGASGQQFNPYGWFDLAINPFTGEILAVTDDDDLFAWDVDGGGLSVVESNIGPSFFLNELLFVPEPGTGLLVALGLLALGRRREFRNRS